MKKSMIESVRRPKVFLGASVFLVAGCISMNSGPRKPASLPPDDRSEITQRLSEKEADVDLEKVTAVPNYNFARTRAAFKEALMEGKKGAERDGEVKPLDLIFNDGGKLLLKISDHREELLTHNLFDTGLKPPVENFQKVCTDELYKYKFPRRTPSGTCYFADNADGENPNIFQSEDSFAKNTQFMGAKGARLGRNTILTEAEVNQARADIMSPNPREVSSKLLKRKNNTMIPAQIANVIATAWLQGQNHDWFSHGRNQVREGIGSHVANTTDPRTYDPEEFEMFTIPAVKEDSEFPGGLRVPKTAPDLSSFARPSLDLTYQNVVTAWWDASHIYGSDPETIKQVRTVPSEGADQSKGYVVGQLYPDGQIAVDEKNRRLYIDEQNLPITGFSDNWWAGLEMIHVLFAMEHNRVARALKQEYGEQWLKDYGSEAVVGDVIFEKARLVISALWAKIHTIEWTPALLTNKALHVGMHANWYGFKDNYGIESNLLRKLTQNMNLSIKHAITGVVGPGTLYLKGVPFTLTEEFVSIYRMHPLVPETLQSVNDSYLQAHRGKQYNLADPKKTPPPLTAGVPLNNTRNERSRSSLIEMGGSHRTLLSMGIHSAGLNTLHNHPTFMTNMEVPRNTDGRPGLKIDLAAADILRDRERLTPRYNAFRERFFLPRVNRFEDLFKKPLSEQAKETVRVLKEVYDDDIDKMDLLVGTLAEESVDLRYHGFGFGNTPFYMFALMASRRLMGDPFFGDYFTPEVYSELGFCWVEKTSMKSMILRHFPELAPSLASVKNAFRPWEVKPLGPRTPKTPDEACKGSDLKGAKPTWPPQDPQDYNR